MQPICYNMYKWGVQMDVGGGNNRKEPNKCTILIDYCLLPKNELAVFEASKRL